MKTEVGVEGGRGEGGKGEERKKVQCKGETEGRNGREGMREEIIEVHGAMKLCMGLELISSGNGMEWNGSRGT